MRTIARTDANHQEIVDAIRGLGFSVHSLHQVGGGVPDIVVGARGVNLFMEIKTPDGKLTVDENTGMQNGEVRLQL